MLLRSDHTDLAEAIVALPPLGWRLGMRLCNLLIAASIVGFALVAFIEARMLELF